MKIAMWSGPRNLSTAMMYAFGQRADCAVVDEPFYGAYLAATGLLHPMRGEVLATMETDADRVAAGISGPNPGGKPHFYQKHMTQHMLPDFPRDWIKDVVNVFLLRHPARVVASFAKGYEHTTPDDIGFVQQATLFDHVVALGQTPVVIDSADIRADPVGMLHNLCDAIGLDWDPAMLSWPKGGHKADGVWKAHWYRRLHETTGFAGPEGPLPELDGDYAAIAAAALPYYERLAALRLPS